MYASQALQPNTLKGQRENPVANCKKKNIQNRPTPKQLERSIIKPQKKANFLLPKLRNIKRKRA